MDDTDAVVLLAWHAQLRHTPLLVGLTAYRPHCLKAVPAGCALLQNVPHVVDADSNVEFVGGINAPMVLRTTDSSGHTQKQLVKSGNDDLRQDAVMQQFFGLVNTLLSNSPASAQRQLSLRTYRSGGLAFRNGSLQLLYGSASTRAGLDINHRIFLPEAADNTLFLYSTQC